MMSDGQNDIACLDILTKCIKLMKLQCYMAIICLLLWKKTCFLKVNHNKEDLSPLVEMSILHHYLRKGLKQIANKSAPLAKKQRNYILNENSNITYCKKLKEKL